MVSGRKVETVKVANETLCEWVRKEAAWVEQTVSLDY